MNRYYLLIETVNDVASRKPEGEIVSLMEIGTHAGNTALRMIQRVQILGRKPRYFGFDLFEDLAEEKCAEEFCGKKRPPAMESVRLRLDSTRAEIRLFKGDTRHTLPAFAKSEPQIMDLVFIDGGHSVETVRNDWEIVRDSLMDRQTVVMLDDCFKERRDVGSRSIIEDIERDESFRVVMTPGDRDRKSGLTIRMARVVRS